MNETSLLETEPQPETTAPLEEDRRWERLEDERTERMMGAKAGLIVAWVIRLVGDYLKERDLGLLFSADCGYQAFPHAPNQVRYPDLSFVRKGRLANDEPPDSNLKIPPD